MAPTSELLSVGLPGPSQEAFFFFSLAITLGPAEILITLLGEPENPLKLWGQTATKGASKNHFLTLAVLLIKTVLAVGDVGEPLCWWEMLRPWQM